MQERAQQLLAYAHRLERKARLLATCKVQSYAIGDGLWSLEVIDGAGHLLGEFVGSNGTREPADDLYAAAAPLFRELEAKEKQLLDKVASLRRRVESILSSK